MAKSLNTMTVEGNLTSDPVSNKVGEHTVVKATIGYSEYTSDPAKKHSSFVQLVFWNKYGEVMARNLKKGMSIVAIGTPREERWTTNGTNGEKVYHSRQTLMVDCIRSRDFIYDRDSNGSNTPQDTPPNPQDDGGYGDYDQDVNP